VNSPTQKNLDTCFLYLKEIEQNKCLNSSSKTACEEKNDGNKNEKKSGIHFDTQLDQLVNQSHSPNTGDDDMMTRYQGSNSI
jgi:hypothetical protein